MGCRRPAGVSGWVACSARRQRHPQACNSTPHQLHTYQPSPPPNKTTAKPASEKTKARRTRHVGCDGLGAQVEGAVVVHKLHRAQRAALGVVEAAGAGEGWWARPLVGGGEQPGSAALFPLAAGSSMRQPAAAQLCMHRAKPALPRHRPHRMDSPSKLAAAWGPSAHSAPSSALSASIWRRCSAVEIANSPPTWQGTTGGEGPRSAPRHVVSRATALPVAPGLAIQPPATAPGCPPRPPAHRAAPPAPSRGSGPPPQPKARNSHPAAAPSRTHLDAAQAVPLLQGHAHVADHALQRVVLVRGAHRLRHRLAQPGCQVAVVGACKQGMEQAVERRG